MAPDIKHSTRQERENYIRENFLCRADCENCGLCQIFRGKTAELVYEDYLAGKVSFEEVNMQLR